MTPQDFIQKAEQGTLTDNEIQEFLGSISKKLMDLKQADPTTYVRIITALSDAMDSISGAVEAVI